MEGREVVENDVRLLPLGQVQGVPVPFSPAGEVEVSHRGLSSKSTWMGVVSVVRDQGWRQLYAGLHINYLKVRYSPRVSSDFQRTSTYLTSEERNVCRHAPIDL